MGQKVRKSITIDEDIWKSLPKYIDTNRSAWFEKKAVEQINSFDDIDEIDLKLETIEYQRKELDMTESDLKQRRQSIIDRRKANENNFELREKAMNLIRLVNNNEGGITIDRIRFIANKNVLDYKILLVQAKREQLNVIDENDFKKK